MEMRNLEALGQNSLKGRGVRRETEPLNCFMTPCHNVKLSDL